MNPEPGTRLGTYTLVDQIGAGGMGVVWKADDPSLKRQVAIKILPADLTADPEWRRRFQQEAESAAALEHPNIAVIHQVGEQDGCPYIVMQYLDGKTLRQLLLDGRLRTRRLLAIAIGIADGLAHAQQHGIVHRDLKPDNVMVTGDGQVKILDFGLAEATGVRSTRSSPSGKILGSRAYMSPEQIRGEPTDHRSDIFAFGVLLYELATGKVPFSGTTDEEVRNAIVTEEPAPLSDRSDGIPFELERVVRKAMEKDPERRYKHADELATDLRNLKRDLASGRAPVITGERPATHLRSTPVASAATPRRRPRATALLVTAVVAVVAIVAVSALGYVWWRTRDRPEPLAAADSAPERTMIVVLPFDNLGDADDEYFAAGITQAITSRLARVSALGVISSKSAVRYSGTDKSSRQIGDELGVDYVLGGSVRWSRAADGQSRVRIAPQLIRAHDDTAVWSDAYDEVIDDLFALESRIADTVIDRIGVALGGSDFQDEMPLTDNLEAYRIFMQAQQLLQLPNYTVGNFNRQLELLDRAIELDPGFAVAYAAASRAHAGIYHFGHDRTSVRQELAKNAVDRALELAPESAEAHFALGTYFYWCHKDYERALEAFDHVRERMPSNLEVLEFVGFIRRRQGRWEESVADLERAAELNPVDANLHAEIGSTFNFMGRYEDAIPPLERSIRLLPQQTTAYFEKTYTHWLAGDLAAARETLERIADDDDGALDWYWFRQELYERDYDAAIARLERNPRETISYFRVVRPRSLMLAQLYELRGDESDAREHYARAVASLSEAIDAHPDDYRLHRAIGMALAGLDREEEAVAAGNLALELYPISRDSVFGPRGIETLALIHTRVGNHDAALDQLEQLLSIPSLISAAMIEADPRFDPLREHPRYPSVIARRDG